MDRENQNEPSTVDGILRKIEEKADTGEYLFRGEPEHYQEYPYYGKVSSNLYREFLKDDNFDVEAEHFDIEELQRAMLGAAKEFSRKPASEKERLAEIQHYGGKTNLIDFTEDYLIALFMACQVSFDKNITACDDPFGKENFGKNGRVILQKKELINSYVERPYAPINRVIAQKSVFVRHPNGFIQPDEGDIVNIPAALKKPIREHLERYHGISVKTIYNDLHGFIRHQSLNLETYKEVYRGLTREQKGDAENG